MDIQLVAGISAAVAVLLLFSLIFALFIRQDRRITVLEFGQRTLERYTQRLEDPLFGHSNPIADDDDDGIDEPYFIPRVAQRA